LRIRIGAHARIRTGDLFLTKWSSIPGEFELILAPPADFVEDHLTRAQLVGTAEQVVGPVVPPCRLSVMASGPLRDIDRELGNQRAGLMISDHEMVWRMRLDSSRVDKAAGSGQN